MNANIDCLGDALKRLGIAYEYMQEYEDAIRLKNSGLCFINSATPFNSESLARLMLDKAFTHNVISTFVQMPKARSYFDPSHPEWEEYKTFSSIEEIAKDIESVFGYPVIVKRNRGSRARNVFISNSYKDIIHALTNIFMNNQGYDYMALAEEYIVPRKEFCLMVSDDRPVFAYEKNIVKPVSIGDTSILRSKYTEAILAGDNKRDELFEFILPALHRISSRWFSADIIEDKTGKLHLIELNSSPGFGYFIRDNGKKLVVDMYEKMLKKTLE